MVGIAERFPSRLRAASVSTAFPHASVSWAGLKTKSSRSHKMSGAMSRATARKPPASLSESALEGARREAARVPPGPSRPPIEHARRIRLAAPPR
jgi:hypothetical protein